MRVHRLQRICDRPSHYQVAVPLIVSRHYVPGGISSRTIINHLLKSRLILIPKLALFQVIARKFPMFIWVFNLQAEPCIDILIQISYTEASILSEVVLNYTPLIRNNFPQSMCSLNPTKCWKFAQPRPVFCRDILYENRQSASLQLQRLSV